MDYPANLWDLSLPSLPQQLAPIDDSDFLSILSKQLNPAAAVPVPPTSAIQEASPPLTDDSSPSPPAAANKGLARPSIDSSKTNKKDNEMHKRKIDDTVSDDDDDDLDGQPQSKSQKESGTKKGKRKSTGPDESRALKRKEQNRAAQRAFRERKEKHVKDLEDQVAALEAKSTSQASENESLRELLSRLQNENLMLKQSAFTFNFPNATTPRGTPTTVQSTSRPSPSAASPADTKTGSTPSSAPVETPRDSPHSNQQLGLTTNSGSSTSGSGFSPLLSFSTIGGSNNGAPASEDTLMSLGDAPLTFFSPPPSNNVPSPYTTIASNPMYTSYTDFSAWDQFFQETAMDQTLAGVTMPSSQQQSQQSAASPSGSRPTVNNSNTGGDRMEDLFSSTNNFNELIPFSSFSPINPVNSPLNGFSVMNAESPVAHSHLPNAFTLESRKQAQQNSGTSPSALPVRSSSPCGGADPDEAPRSGSLHAGMTPEEAAKHATDQCPRSAEDLSKIIESQPLSTLGTFPSADELKQLKVREVFESIKHRADMQDLDMDKLCAELKAKARCDGTLGDEPCKELQEIVAGMKAQQAEQRLQTEAKAKAAEAIKQQQASLTGSTIRPSIFSNPGPATSQASNLDMFAFPPFTMSPSSSRPSLQAPRQSVDSGSSISTLPTPVSAQSLDSTMMDSSSWMMNLDIPAPQSPTSQFLSYLNMGALGTADGGFSPNSYLNLPPEKE